MKSLNNKEGYVILQARDEGNFHVEYHIKTSIPEIVIVNNIIFIKTYNDKRGADT